MSSPEIVWDDDPNQNNEPLDFDTNRGKPLISTSDKRSNSRDRNRRQAPARSGRQPPWQMGTTGNYEDTNLTPRFPLHQGLRPPPNNNMFPPFNQQQMQPPRAENIGPLNISMLSQMVRGNLQNLLQQPGGQGIFPMPQPTPAGLMPMAPPVKQRLHIGTMILYPPSEKSQQAPTRMRPPGCKTIFVGGLPEKITEEMIDEIFHQCGPIESIRLSKKKFCHIRFMSIECVDRALSLSGYRIRINDSSEVEMSGKMHVDFAEARNDQQEYDHYVRNMEREIRYKEEMEREQRNLLDPPPPPSFLPYSDYELQRAVESMKDNDDISLFTDAANKVVTWLDRGECNKHTAGKFYNLCQVAHGHIRRIHSEKIQVGYELERAKAMHKEQLTSLSTQFEQIGKVFSAVSKQKAWDHFSKAQRKTLETWRKQAQEAKKLYDEEMITDEDDGDEMEMSGDEEAMPDSTKREASKNAAHSQSSSMTTDELLAASLEYRKKMEKELSSSEPSVADNKDDEGDDSDHVTELQSQLELKDKQIKSLQDALQGMVRKNMSCTTSTQSDKEMKLRDELSTVKSQLQHYQYDCERLRSEAAARSRVSIPISSSSSSPVVFSRRKSRLIGLISTFLLIHPQGASVDYVASYLSSFYNDIRNREIEDILDECYDLFEERVSGVGAMLARKWVYRGLQLPNMPSTSYPQDISHLFSGEIEISDDETNTIVNRSVDKKRMEEVVLKKQVEDVIHKKKVEEVIHKKKADDEVNYINVDDVVNKKNVEDEVDQSDTDTMDKTNETIESEEMNDDKCEENKEVKEKDQEETIDDKEEVEDICDEEHVKEKTEGSEKKRRVQRSRGPRARKRTRNLKDQL